MIANLLIAGLLMLDPGPHGEGFQDGSTAGVRLENSKIVLTGTGLSGKSDGYQLKRPCWYEPDDSATGMLDRFNNPEAWQGDEASKEKYRQFLEQFKDKIGQEGSWWTPAYNGSDPNGSACSLNLPPFVWVEPGTTPANGLTIEDLVDIARAALTVPEPKIELNPDVKSYVNLPTWVWLDGAGETTRSVTATLPGVMSATVTANLSDLEIDSGTTEDRATVETKGCGMSGTPYKKGADFTCGVSYKRASIDQPRGVYVLEVTSVWEIDIEDDVVPFAYDPVEVGATRDVPVGEVQSTVRKTG
ncbi:hypothetical protein [Streptosporangium sp. NPDC002524]|uniref:hypothetical protein n=1 Tax=Streptosporangium sp. NPDC002524 TaxID=3154537 RepID=UPI003321C7FC